MVGTAVPGYNFSGSDHQGMSKPVCIHFFSNQLHLSYDILYFHKLTPVVTISIYRLVDLRDGQSVDYHHSLSSQHLHRLDRFVVS